MHLRASTRSAFSLLEQWACPCNPSLNLFWLPVHLTNYLKSKSLLRPYFILLNLCCPTVSTLIGIFLPLAPSLQEGCQPRACCALVLPHQISYLFLCSLHSHFATRPGIVVVYFTAKCGKIPLNIFQHRCWLPVHLVNQFSSWPPFP